MPIRRTLPGAFLPALIAGCTGDLPDVQIYWKDTWPLSAAVTGMPPAVQWQVEDASMLVGRILPTTTSGFAAPVHDPEQPLAWIRGWGKAGNIQFDTEVFVVHAPSWAVLATTPTGTLLASFSGAAEAGGDSMRNLNLVVGPSGSVLLEQVGYEWVPWTMAAGMGSADALVLAQPDPGAQTVYCRVSVSNLNPIWCDDPEMSFRAWEEDDERSWDHAYVPVVGSIAMAGNGDFFLAGTLRGVRETACCEGCACPEASTQVWVARYTQLGAQVWFTRFASEPWVIDDVPVGVAPTLEDGLLVGGWWSPREEGGRLAQSAFVVRFDAEGRIEFARSYEAEGSNVFTAFAPDGRGGALAHVASAGLGADLLMDIDEDGDVVWSTPFDAFETGYAVDPETRGFDTSEPGVEVHATPESSILLVAYGDAEARRPTRIAKLR